jgi:shikimate kinase
MRTLILCGHKGCGKTRLGQEVARELGLPFIDLDAMIVDKYRAEEGSVVTLQTCREIYEHHGQHKFRALEAAAVRSLLPSLLAVVATGAGVVLDPDNVQQLKALGVLVFLNVRPEILWKRLSVGPVPATLDPHDLQGSFARSYAERQPLYEAAADVVVEASDRPEREIIRELVELAS